MEKVELIDFVKSIDCIDCKVIFELLKFTNVNFQDKHGNTDLINAIFHKNIKIIKYLIEKGADINAKNEDGYTALDLASINENNENNEIIKILENAGAN